MTFKEKAFKIHVRLENPNELTNDHQTELESLFHGFPKDLVGNVGETNRTVQFLDIATVVLLGSVGNAVIVDAIRRLRSIVSN